MWTIVRCTVVYRTPILGTMNIQKKYGIKVKEFRIKKGWSQEKLALNADIDRTYISGIEKGERNVSIVVVEKIAVALDIHNKFFFESNSPIKE